MKRERTSGGAVSKRRALALWAGLALAGTALAGTGPTTPAAQEGQREVRVTVALANVRSQPSPAGKVLFQLKQGQTAKLVGTAGDWQQIEDAGGRRGYVYGTLVRLVEPARTAAAAPAPPKPAAPALAIDHKEVGCIVAEQYPKLDACFNPEESLGRAQVHFRALDTDPWYSVELRKDGPCFTAYLPKPMRSTKEVQYYVDVVDRGFGERQQPQGAPDGAYRVRVVKKDSQCGGLGRIAYAVGKLAKPIVVGVARTAAGATVDAAALELLQGHLLLAGFRPEGVILAATGGAPATTTAASGGAGGSGGAAGGAAGGGAVGGGIGVGTLALVGGGLAAAGVGVAAASSGGGDSSGGGGGGGSQANLTGRWQGAFTFNEAVRDPISGTINMNCTFPNMVLDLTHSGSSLSGSMAPGAGTCNVSAPGAPPFVDTGGGGGSIPVTGTATNGRATIVWNPGGNGCPPATLDGTYGASNLTTTMDITCTMQSIQVRVTGGFNGTKR